MGRTAILGRIRCALDTAQSEKSPVLLPEFPNYKDPVRKFGKELEAAGGHFFDAREEKQLLWALSSVLRKSGAEVIHWETQQIFYKHRIPFKLRGIQETTEPVLMFSTHDSGSMEFPVILNSKRYSRDALEHIKLSASSAHSGIAETGTVVHAVQFRRGRILSVLPPAHVVFLSQNDLRMNHAQLFSSLQPSKKGSAMTLVTGPSRTADIEKTLVLGVHGPKQFFVVLTA